MSELMTDAIIGMPFDMAMNDYLSRLQFHSRAQALLAERDQLKAENERLKAQLACEVELNVYQEPQLDQLRKQLDEARELLMLGGFADALVPRICAWLEATKP